MLYLLFIVTHKPTALFTSLPAIAGKCDERALEEALASDDVPRGVTPLMWMAIKSIKQDTATTTTEVRGLKTRLEDLERKDGERDDEMTEMRQAIDIMGARLQHSEISQTHLINEIEDLKARSMRDNVVINFDPDCQDDHEVKNEDGMALASAFFSNVLGVKQVYVPPAHRLGKPIAGRQRPLIVRIPNSSDRSRIFQNATRLKDTRHFISSQIPPSRTERKLFALPVFQSKRDDPQNRASLKQDKLYIRGKLQTQFSKPTLPVYNDGALEYDISSSKDKKDGGSCFRGYYCDVPDLQGVTNARTQLICRPEVKRANHVIFAYRLPLQRGKLLENFDSDHDWNTGLELLKEMHANDITGVCYATRQCNPGYTHIGKKRFTIINELCVQAYTYQIAQHN